MKKISVAIPIYNEGESLRKFIESLIGQLESFEYKVYFCFNGCTDDSEKILKEIIETTPLSKMCILHSQRGKTCAQNTIVKEITKDGRSDYPILFLDSDIVLGDNVVLRLYEELIRVSTLKAVGATTCPLDYDENTKAKLTYLILNIRNIHPLSQIAKNDVSVYKEYVDKFPQPGITPENEKTTKIFFHGRCYMLRDARCFSIPENEDMADDTYLPNYIHSQFGPSSIRNIFDAVVYYKAYTSFRVHFKTYRRIEYNLKRMDKKYPGYSKIRYAEQLKMNWQYIFKLSKKEIALFTLHLLWLKLEKLCYKLLPARSLEDLWKYERK